MVSFPLGREGIIFKKGNKEDMSKLTFTNKDKFAKEVLGYKSYKKFIVPAATDEIPGTLELDIADVVVIPEKEIVEYFTKTFSKEGLTVESDFVFEEQPEEVIPEEVVTPEEVNQDEVVDKTPGGDSEPDTLMD